MALIKPEFLQRPFADSGTISQVPQTSPSGFVNYTDGYTSSYEISLAANNPQAKAVERPIQNYLFKTLTQNALAWQRMSHTAWQGADDGNTVGYDKGAFVLRAAAGGEALLYRSLVDNNLSDPINTPASWEVQPTVATTVGRIPMPLGGANGASAAPINVGVDFNSVPTGTFEVVSDTVAVACANLPIYPGSPQARAGLLEAIGWTYQTFSYVHQRYTDRMGNMATRTSLNGAWELWNFKPSLNQVQAGVQNYSTITTTNGGANYTGTTTPPPQSMIDGMEIRVIIAGAGNLANATFNYASLTANAPIFGMSGARVTANELRLGCSATLRWNAGNGWLIMAVSGGFLSGRYTAVPSQLVVAGQAQDGSMTYSTDTGSTTTTNAYFAEFVPPIPGPSAGMVLRFLAATTNTGSPTFRCTASGAVLPIRDISGGTISAGIIQAGSICEITYNLAQNAWLLTGTTGTSAASSVPVGGIILVSTPTVPVGFLECDGSLQKIAMLPSLYATIGTYYNAAGDPSDSFRLPNGRGVFIRGFDNGRGVDAGRTLGSFQQQDIQSHAHTATTTVSYSGDHTHAVWPLAGVNSGGNVVNAQVGAGNTGPNTGLAGNHTHTVGVTIAAAGGAETRPINMAWMYCIKAFDVPINQGTIDVAALLTQVNAQKRMAPGKAVYANAGSYTFIVPNDVTSTSVFEVDVWGGGAGGSGVHPSLGANGGGAGGHSYRLITGLTAGQGISVIVGSGGSGGVSGGAGGAGGSAGTPSLFGSYCVANGGAVSGFTGTVWPPAAGGQASGGDVNSSGGCGGAGQQIGATTAGAMGGNGGDCPGGGGGGRGGWTGVVGSAGSFPGGGGGGGGPAVGGGNGSVGCVLIKYS